MPTVYLQSEYKKISLAKKTWELAKKTMLVFLMTAIFLIGLAGIVYISS